MVLLKQKRRLQTRTIQEKIDYKQVAATLRRNNILKIKSDKCRLHNERVQEMSCQQKLKRYLELSESSIKQDFEDYFGGEDIIPRPPSSISSYSSDETVSPLSPSLEIHDEVETTLNSKDLIANLESIAETFGSQALASKTLNIQVFENLPLKAYQREFSILLPSITRFTLSELDLSEILSNPQLRHDLVFDDDLQFKPNKDDNGIKSIQDILYWIKVAQEFENKKFFRVPLLLHEIKAIIKSVLPSSFSRQVESNIDIALISHQLEHQVFDPTQVFMYIHSLLSQNCAPIRDQLVLQLLNNAKELDFALYFRGLFDLLELMKLDAANHQLQKIRPTIIQSAPDFEFTWFEISNPELRVPLLKQTFTETRNSLLNGTTPFKTTPSFKNVHSILILNLIRNGHELSNVGYIPLETFTLDTNLLQDLYNDIQDLTSLITLLTYYKKITINSVPLKEVKERLWILLNDPETTLQHIVAQITYSAGITSEDEIVHKIDSFVERVLCGTVDDEHDNGPVFQVVYDRLFNSILSYLNTGIIDVFFKDFEQDMLDICKQVVKIADFNRLVYTRVHKKMWSEIVNE